jgi:hypothetical protein
MKRMVAPVEQNSFLPRFVVVPVAQTKAAELRTIVALSQVKREQRESENQMVSGLGG